MSNRDRQLSWHREYLPGAHKRVVTGVKAWAVLLDPDATMSPYYRIVQIQRNLPVRVVILHDCIACGGKRVEICVESNLAAAKAAAQSDYEERVAEQMSVPLASRH